MTYIILGEGIDGANVQVQEICRPCRSRANDGTIDRQGQIDTIFGTNILKLGHAQRGMAQNTHMV